ncbi:MAG: ATP synthase F0 subunit B [Ilumatobacteraceae bacterium]|nr:ATP synthase F0 subunit B [Ilumatobacteraceae bacterium]
MLTAVVTSSGSLIEVALYEGASTTETDDEQIEDQVEEELHESLGPEEDLNPIFPEVKEVVWGFGAFIVLALVMRLFLFRKVRDGMTSRYDDIQGDFEEADTLTASARADVAEYEAQVGSVRADAQSRVEAARATLEAERADKVGAVNARISDKRAAAAADVEAARAAARPEVESAVAEVAALAGQLATGKAPDADAVAAAVRSAMGMEVPA